MQEQDIPIDINTNKLLEWLINRRHCSKDWQSKILDIRKKINEAIKDMPAHPLITKLLTGTHINYFHCKKIIEILKETEADSKNVFGRYGSKRMKDWLQITSLYEQDNIYLAEAAQILMRNVKFEVPGLKKQIQKSEQMQIDFDKKEEEYKKLENIAHSEFNTLCKQLGISGQKIKQELIEMIKELPNIYKTVATKTEILKDDVEFYKAFVEFTFGRQYTGGCIPLIRHIMEKGNTTTYEWKYGIAPVGINEPPFTFSVDDDDVQENNDIIDFGNDDNEINFGGDNLNNGMEDIQLNEGEIDWGANPNGQALDNSLDSNLSSESGIVILDNSNEGIASDSEALTILDNPETRNEFINQLFELESFLKMRLYEFKNDSKSFLNMSQVLEISSIIQLSTENSTQIMLDQVQVIISEILRSKTQHLHNIKHCPRYVDTLAFSLKQKKEIIHKMETLQQSIQAKREELRKEVHTTQQVLKLIIEKTKELQYEIEKDISKKYKNRIVKLSGGINILSV